MENRKFALIHCLQSSNYKLIDFTKKMNEADDSILWVFDASDKRLGERLAKNLNLVSY